MAQGNAGDPKLLSPLTLAFLGDAVFDLMAREQIVRRANAPAKQLHRQAVRQVNCRAQAAAAAQIAPYLSEEEAEIFRRGRNAHTNHLPRHSDPADYHAATGLEALFGYLYMQVKQDRLRELFRLTEGRGGGQEEETGENTNGEEKAHVGTQQKQGT